MGFVKTLLNQWDSASFPRGMAPRAKTAQRVWPAVGKKRRIALCPSRTRVLCRVVPRVESGKPRAALRAGLAHPRVFLPRRARFAASTSAPIAVAGGLHFSEIRAGNTSCALTPARAAYCWGFSSSGSLGTGTESGPDQCGTSSCATTPKAVASALQFSTLGVRNYGACGLSSGAQGTAYCWGLNYQGDLGIGDTTGPELCTGGSACSTVPVAVAGGLSFTALTAGNGGACALTGTGAAYCWGLNAYGQLGDSTDVDRSAPVAVARGLVFVAVSTGGLHTCGLTSDGSAYCWGWNSNGQLGTGSSTGPETCLKVGGQPCSTVPVRVAGVLQFTAISVGYNHTCAVTSAGAVYCWGENGWGELGTGSTKDATEPTPVSGELSFVQVTAGSQHTCGVTTAGVAYCWGRGDYGQLGNGSTTGSLVPIKVAGQP